ncbi:MAG: J domain-containing protein [Bacteroidia bacterium]
MAEKNYYILLEVKSTATAEEIKNSYRLLAKKYHPDKNVGNKAAEEYFKEIQQAYAVLSNPEKRRKYDQLFFRTANPQTAAKAYTNPAYSGNAYQYAQQQAQAKQRATHTAKEPAKPDRTESWQILVSVGVAMVLLYFIISYSSDKPKDETTGTPPVQTEVASAAPSDAPAIGDFDSPYTAYFGDEVVDSGSKNSINIANSSYSEAVVCLVQAKAPNKVIRNQYMNTGHSFKMNEIPDGDYFLRIYYGNNWDPDKTFLNKAVKGGFKMERGFAILNTGKNVLKMKREKTGNVDSYSSYEITISPQDADKNGITAEEFFKK